jgi:hypothetical protein
MRANPPLIAILLLALCPACRAADAAPSATTQPVSLFDAARHMRLDEVRPRMRGYGLSVFAGTQIERFDVQVLSILRNFNPGHDVILVRLSGHDLERTGAIAGMSGSPIYLLGQDGQAKLAGAFAYGWAMTNDPIGGVQPIEDMLKLIPAAPPAAAAAAAPAASTGRVSWRPEDSFPVPWSSKVPDCYPLASQHFVQPNPQVGLHDADSARLRPLVTPLLASGLPPRLLDQFEAIFRAHGLVPLQAGGGSGTTVPADAAAATLEPGAVLAVPLLIGDVDLTAIGTVTESLNGRVFGFGHPFLSEGTIELPMGTGEIQGVVANLVTSFKLGAMRDIAGTLDSDQAVGVAGQEGGQAPMAPIELHITYSDGSLDRHYSFRSALHQRLTAVISMAAVSMALNGERELPPFHTLDYDLSIEFANGRTIRAANTVVNVTPADLLLAVGAPMIAAANNPFERVMIRKVTGTIAVAPEAREASLVSITVPRQTYRPGQTLRAQVTYRPFRGPEATLPFEFALPSGLDDGEYKISVSDYETFLVDEQKDRPYRFTADSIAELFAALQDLATIRHDALYVRLVREADGVAVGQTAMPRLPGSRRQVMLGGERSNVVGFTDSPVQVVPTRYVISGSQTFTIKIDRTAPANLAEAAAARAEPETRRE